MNELDDLFASPGDAGLLRRLHAELEHAAARDELLDVAYTTVDSPVGALLLAATERGIVRVAFDVEDHARVLDLLAQQLSPRVLRAPRRLDGAARELEEYFGGRRTRFDLPLDRSLSKGFRLLVQQHIPEIGYGQTRSYRQVAELVGNPRAVRAVASACATNPLPLVVPCHRVVLSNGKSGEYVGGAAAKTALLTMEAQSHDRPWRNSDYSS
jgi:methylated-DNA-[protein]-cysteine S-methyltransferase